MNEKLQKFQALKVKHEKKVKIGGVVAVLGLILTLALISYGPYGIIVVIPGLIMMTIGFSSFKNLSNRFKTEVLADSLSSLHSRQYFHIRP